MNNCDVTYILPYFLTAYVYILLTTLTDIDRKMKVIGPMRFVLFNIMPLQINKCNMKFEYNSKQIAEINFNRTAMCNNIFV